MLKQRIVRVIVGLALLATVVGSTGIVANELGLSIVPQAFACENPSSSGGGC
jgi:hypothetical protein